jgi:hypothetical protein
VHTVAVGASAGGIEALRSLVAQLPSDSPAAGAHRSATSSGTDGDALRLEAVNRGGKAVRVELRFAPLASNGNEVRSAILMMEATDG